MIQAHERFIDSFVFRFFFDQRLGTHSWHTDFSNAVNFWSVYLSHLLTNCNACGYIHKNFRAQYHTELQPWHIRMPARGASDNGVGVQQFPLPDIQRRTRSGRVFATADDSKKESAGEGGSTNAGSDSDDPLGWPADWNMIELIPEEYEAHSSAATRDPNTGSSASPARPPPETPTTGYVDDQNPAWATAAVKAVQHMNEQLGSQMSLTPTQHLLGVRVQRSDDEEKVDDSDDSNGVPSLERSSGSDEDNSDSTDEVQSGFRDNGQTRSNQSGGMGPHNTRDCSTCQTLAIRRNTSQGSVDSMLFDPNKFVHFKCNADKSVPGVGQGGTCFSLGHEGDWALILSREYHRLRAQSPPRASQVVLIQEK